MPTSDARAGVWEVVKVPFPYSSRPVRQRRPALLVTPGQPIDAPFVIWVLMITSAGNRPWAGHVRITDLDTAELRGPSVVRTDKIATIEMTAAEPIGTLSPADRETVAARLAALFAGIL